MNIQINGKNITVSDDLEQTVAKKLKKLEKYFKPDAVAYVRLASVKKREIAEVTIRVDGIVIRGEEASDDLRTSLDRVVEKVEKQILHHKTRLAKRVRDGSLAEWVANLAPVDMDYEVEDEDDSVVTRDKRFSTKPMEVEEAILQLQMVDHDFFAFQNAATGRINVLYRRKEGGYGLLEPEED